MIRLATALLVVSPLAAITVPNLLSAIDCSGVCR